MIVRQTPTSSTTIDLKCCKYCSPSIPYWLIPLSACLFLSLFHASPTLNQFLQPSSSVSDAIHTLLYAISEPKKGENGSLKWFPICTITKRKTHLTKEYTKSFWMLASTIKRIFRIECMEMDQNLITSINYYYCYYYYYYYYWCRQLFNVHQSKPTNLSTDVDHPFFCFWVQVSRVRRYRIVCQCYLRFCIHFTITLCILWYN